MEELQIVIVIPNFCRAGKKIIQEKSNGIHLFLSITLKQEFAVY